MTKHHKIHVNNLGKFSVATSLGLLILFTQPAFADDAVDTKAAETETASPAATSTETASPETTGTETTGTETTNPETTNPETTSTEMANPEAAGTKAVSLGKIEVTGSHIKRVDMEGPSPLLVFDREDIDKSGAASVAEFIRDLPINTGYAFDESSAKGTAPGGASFNLRGLGQDGTLVLIDGRRIATYGFAQEGTTTFVDLNSIPLAAVERIEILKDGASAIYGSDAIAGVVNIILRKDIDDTEVTVGGGTTSQGGGTEKRANMLTGVSNDKNNMTFMFDYFHRSHIGRKDRKFSKNADHTSQGGTDQRSFYNPVANIIDPGTGAPLAINGFYNFNQDIDLIPATERYGTMVNFNHEINPNITLFTQAMVSQINTDLNFTYTPGAFFVPSTNPYNTYGQDVFVLWRMTDVGIRKFHTETNATRFVTGLDGKTEHWDWNSAFDFSRSSSVVIGENQVSMPAAQDAIDNGTLNVFGTSPNSPSVIDSIRTTINRTGLSESKSLDIKASTDLAELEHGLLQLAIGGARRHDLYADTPDAQTANGQVIGIGATSAKGSRDTTSLYSELDWPVLDNVEVQLAARHEKYSDFGSTTNPKVAVRYQPTSTLVLRASAGTGFRAPALTELYLAGGSGLYTLVDTTRCAATSGASGCTPSSYPISFTGDPNLKAEKSRSTYLGAVYEPLQGLSFGLDLWDYKHTNVIDLNSQYVVDNESKFPGRVVRAVPGDPTSPIIQINDTLTNIANEKTNGYDANIKYKKNFGSPGILGINEYYSRVLEFKRQPYSGQPYQNLAGTYHYPTWKSKTSFSWTKGDFYSELSANYTSSYKGIDPSTKVDSFLTFDLQLSYSGWGSGTATIGVKNLADKAPPFANEEAGYDFAIADPRGRFVYAQYTQKL